MRRHGFPHGTDDGRRIERVRKVRPDNLPAAPVDERREVHVASLHRDVGDVNRPNLVWELRFVIPQQVRHDGLLEVPFGKVDLRINGMDAHVPHESPHGLSADVITFLLQFHDDLAGTEIRMLGVPVFASGEIRQIASVEKRQFGSAEIRQFESIEKSQS